jgi:hypothetical protein
MGTGGAVSGSAWGALADAGAGMPTAAGGGASQPGLNVFTTSNPANATVTDWANRSQSFLSIG